MPRGLLRFISRVAERKKTQHNREHDWRRFKKLEILKFNNLNTLKLINTFQDKKSSNLKTVEFLKISKHVVVAVLKYKNLKILEI